MTLDASENVWPQPWRAFQPAHKPKPPKKKKGAKVSRTPTRRDDERLLCWLQMRDAGMTTRQIGEAWGVTKNAVIGAINRVTKEDVE
jgi:hypothetical protein